MKLLKIKLLVLFTLFLLAFISSYAQDTIVMKDKTVLAGEMKEMDRGVITLKTSYSDSDFKIEYLEVKEIISGRTFRFSLSNGDRYFGTISADTSNNQLRIFDVSAGFVIIQPKDLVYLKQVNQGNIFDILNLSLDLGYTFTKSNNLHQFNSTVHADYYRIKWGVSGKLDVITNVQDNVEPMRRKTGEVAFNVFHKKDFFTTLNGDFFSNNEQKIDLRSTYTISFGKYFVHTNRVYFNSSIGLAYTFENYSDTIQDKQSVEGRFRVEYNMFDLGDFNMFTSLVLYPSLTEKSRLRSQMKVTVKYDFPRDFYLKGNIDYNYDNKPIEGSSPDDYVYSFGVGWEL